MEDCIDDDNFRIEAMFNLFGNTKAMEQVQTSEDQQIEKPRDLSKNDSQTEPTGE